MIHNKRTKWSSAALVAVLAIVLSACNLGQNNVPEPVTGDPNAQGVPDDTGGVEGVDGTTGEQPAPVEEQPETVEEQTLPPTNTPTGELLPTETLGPITIDNSDALRTQEAVTVRVQRGTAVSGVTCSWTLSDTGATQALGTPATNELDANSVQDVYTFTPAAAGTYVVSCQGEATTASGQRQVNATSSSFAVEAKAA